MFLTGKTKNCLIGLVLFGYLALAPIFAFADSYGDKATFNIDKTYDAAGRAKSMATLVWAGEKIYFYVDDVWWFALTSEEQAKYNAAFQNLNNEFTKNIYPKLTSVFGSDQNKVVNKDGKITILVHPMAKDAGGYFNTGDGYLRPQAPLSNEREMVYLNTRFINTSLAKAYLAHEFTHLITFNQKDILRNVSEDVWLNEARSEYSSTILGYDDNFDGSNFDQRVRSFSADSGKSIAEWLNKPANYGAVHLFMQYLVDQYGLNILADSMASDDTGIDSINAALKKANAAADFNGVFRDWLITLLVNDCQIGPRYCYKNAALKKFNIAPKINYLPTSDQVSLSVMYNTTYFSGNWQRVVGGNGDLFLEFFSGNYNFNVPYLLCYAGNTECNVGDLSFGGQGKATLNLPDFGRQYASLTLMPFSSAKTTHFDPASDNLSYSFKVSINPRGQNPNSITDNTQTIAQMLAQIETLKKKIAQIQSVLAARVAPLSPDTVFCKALAADLYYGVENTAQVRCLQQFLKTQGFYSGAITGSFSIATKDAVIRFQEKYAREILIPLGLRSGTGYVSRATRKKINQLLLSDQKL